MYRAVFIIMQIILYLPDWNACWIRGCRRGGYEAWKLELGYVRLILSTRYTRAWIGRIHGSLALDTTFGRNVPKAPCP